MRSSTAGPRPSGLRPRHPSKFSSGRRHIAGPDRSRSTCEASHSHHRGVCGVRRLHAGANLPDSALRRPGRFQRNVSRCAGATSGAGDLDVGPFGRFGRWTADLRLADIGARFRSAAGVVIAPHRHIGLARTARASRYTTSAMPRAIRCGECRQVADRSAEHASPQSADHRHLGDSVAISR